MRCWSAIEVSTSQLTPECQQCCVSVAVSGRSSAYGDAVTESAVTGARSETSSVGAPTGSMHQEIDGSDPTDQDLDTVHRLHGIRLQLLQHLIRCLPDVRSVGGVRAIPFMQVLLMLTSDLDSEEDKDRAALDSLLSTLLNELNIQRKVGVGRIWWKLSAWLGYLNSSVLVMISLSYFKLSIEGILPKGPYPPCLRMADRALLAGYPRNVIPVVSLSSQGMSLQCFSLGVTYLLLTHWIMYEIMIYMAQL